MVLGLLTRAVSRVGARVASRPALAAGAGATGGVLLDDVPVIGKKLDPTEGGGGGLSLITLVLVAVIGLLVLDNLGGS